MAFSNQIQHRFAGFEENLNLPALSINTDNLFFGKGRICTDKSKPVLAIRFVLYANDFRWNRILLPIMSSPKSLIFQAFL